MILDTLAEQGIDEKLIEELADIFLVNLKFVGLLQVKAGAERILTVEHLLEDLSQSIEETATPPITIPDAQALPITATSASQDFDAVCFYITPIGDPDSEFRKHSDLFLEHLVRPALEKHGLKVIRADQIDKPGMITRQVIEYILKAKLVIADLSFSNPNVFYELALRHATRLPTVQIIRTGDKIPFDVGQSRTIQIDCTNIYTLVPKIETHRAEIGNQVRRALESPDVVDNPISTFHPNFRVVFD